MSSSPFAYSMPQQHQGNTFGGMSAVPSPPTVLYGASQAMHSGPHTNMYQAFPHVEPSQVSIYPIPTSRFNLKYGAKIKV
jgi:hypothetical protein